MSGRKENTLSRTVARGAGVTTLSGIGAQAIMLATYVTFARLAPPEVFGTFAAASILVAVGSLFVESGMTAALVHRRDRIQEAASTALVSTTLGGIATSLLAGALAPLVGLIFDRDDITAVALAVSAVPLLNAAVVVPSALLQRDFAYVRSAFVDPAWMATYGGVGAFLLSRGHGVWALVAGTYCAGLVRVLLLWTLLGRRRFRRPSFRLWLELAGYARHVLASEVFRHAGAIAHTAGIGRVIGTHDLGQYNFGSQMAMRAGTPIVAGAANVLFPAFARIATDRRRLSWAFERALASVTFATVPLSLALLAVGEPLVVLLLGRRWEDAGEVLASLGPAGAALAIISISTELMKATGRPELLPRIHVLSALAPIAAVTIGVSFGIVVVGALTSIGLLGVAVFALAKARPIVERSLSELARIAAGPVAVGSGCALALAICERLVDSPSHGTAIGLVILVVESLAAALVYGLAMRRVSPKTWSAMYGSLLLLSEGGRSRRRA